MHADPLAILDLIDAYAAARAARETAHRECTAWAFADADAAMRAARDAVAAVLGAVDAPGLDDPLTRAAADVRERDRAWQSRIDAALTGGAR